MESTRNKSWAVAIGAKRSGTLDKIPEPWRISPKTREETTETTTFGVHEIPKRCGVLTSQELSLTEDYDATDLVAMLQGGKAKSEEVVRAFCKRAAIAHQLVGLPVRMCIQARG